MNSQKAQAGVSEPDQEYQVGRVGIGVIGRNEGERLRRCLLSVVGKGVPVVYVDSGSTDGSAELARSMGVEVVELDTSAPFTPGRGRNAGLDRLLEKDLRVELVQFIDGDSELAEGWLDQGAQALKSRPDVAVVCGRLRERRRGASIYKRLCDMEWNGPLGEIDACGGIAMIRVGALREVCGFNPGLVRGADPELYLRLRRAGWRIVRIRAEMAVHDAAMACFGQWWKRCVRTGRGYAEGAALHGRSPERHYVRECRSIWFWAFVLPLLIATAAWSTKGLGLLLLVIYPLQVGRISARRLRQGEPSRDAALYALFCVLSKLPHLVGLLKFLFRRGLARRTRAAEYKGC